MATLVSQSEEELKAIYERLSQDPEWKDILPPIDLPEEDGEPLEDSWHRFQMNVLIDSINADKTGKENFYVGGNMFVYFMVDQVEKTGYKGPDFFYVKDVSDPMKHRGKWVVWLEGGKYPDVIIEFLSPSTRKEDLTKKKDLYERVFRTREYYCVDNKIPKLYAWRLGNSEYKEIEPDEKGFVYSKELGYKLGFWQGKYLQREDLYLRFFNEKYELIPTHGEFAEQRAEQEKQRAEQEKQRAEQEKQRAEQEKQRAEQEKQRADKLEKELLELKKKLGIS